MTFAQTLTDKERRKAARTAIYSALCGCIPEMTVDTGAIIVVYIAMLGGGDATKMLATGLTPVAMVFFCLLFSGVCDRFGLRRGITVACSTAFFAFCLMAAAPWAGSARLGFLLAACLLYSLTRPLYITGWYPIVDNFLRPEDRSRFFSIMRFGYSTLNACLMLAIGKLMASFDNDPPIWVLQAVIFLFGFGNLGRMHFLCRVPIAPELKNPPLRTALHATGQKYSLREGLRVSFRNGPLVGFCIYFCLYNVVACSFLPLSIVYMKSAEFNAPPSAIMSMGAVSLAGSLIGFLFSSRLLRAIGTRAAILAGHAAAGILPAALFLCSPSNPHKLLIVGAAQFLASAAAAMMMVVNSMESLALARPGNKTVALAVCQVFCNIGSAAGRFGTAAVLACGILAPAWNLGALSVTRFQSLFLVDAILMVFFLILLVLLPAFVPKHEDYYEP